MKNLKLMLLGIALLLFGVCAALLAGLAGTPLFRNGEYELMAVLCPFAGLALAVWGFFWKDKGWTLFLRGSCAASEECALSELRTC